MAEVVEEHVEHTLGCGVECALLQKTLGENTVLDRDTTIEVHQGEGGRDDLHTRMSLACADERGHRLADLRKDIHRNVLGDLDRRVGNAVRASERILNHLNDGRVLTRTHNKTQNTGKLLELCLCRYRLREVKVHLIAVKVSVIRLGGRNVQAERRTGQDLDTMALHRSLVERRLTVEEHVVTIDHVAVNYIALMEIDHIGVHVLERHHALLLLQEHGLGTGVLHTVLDIHHQAITVVGRDNLGLGEVRGNLLRDTQFIDINVGVGRNHRTGREVHTLTHEVTTHTTRLGTETGLQGLERATRPLGGRGHTLDIVIHIGRHIILQKLGVFLNILTGLTCPNEFTELLITANNVDENMGEIVVHALIILHHDWGAHSQRRNCQNRTHHPRRVRELRVKSEDLHGILSETLETAENHL